MGVSFRDPWNILIEALGDAVAEDWPVILLFLGLVAVALGFLIRAARGK